MERWWCAHHIGGRAAVWFSAAFAHFYSECSLLRSHPRADGKLCSLKIDGRIGMVERGGRMLHGWPRQQQMVAALRQKIMHLSEVAQLGPP